MRSQPPASPTAAEQTYIAFWSRFTRLAELHGVRYRTPPGHRQSWYGWGLGAAKTVNCARVSITRSTASVFVSIGSGPQLDEIYQPLVRDREAIERALQATLRWQDDTKEHRIFQDWSQELDPSEWDEVIMHLFERLAAFDEVFGPRVRRT